MHTARTLLALIPLTLAFAAFAGGCSVDLKTTGNDGHASFTYEMLDGECFIGCGLDRNALQGSLVTVDAQGNDGEALITARITDAALGTVSAQRDSCQCAGAAATRDVPRTTACAAGETKTCTLSIDIETVGAGDATLELDEGTNVWDSTTLHVRPAGRIDSSVTEGATQVDGIWQTHAGSKVQITSSVYDSSGNPMAFAQHGLSFSYADPSVVGPDPSVIIGSTDVEDALAGSKTGDTIITASAPGAQTLISVRVLP